MIFPTLGLKFYSFCLVVSVGLPYLCGMIIKKVSRYIGEQALFVPGDRLLVALSGGADSVALLRLLLQLGFCCEAAHCNFHLRGDESNRDERFVSELCRSLDIPLHITHFDTYAEAAQRKVSIEMIARDLRYDWFERLRCERSLSYIAVAHHGDDNVETFLLNLLRGTGINGLCGIRPKNGYVVRPLLCLGRQDILGYLEEIGQSYVTDSTNQEDGYLRNRVRLRLLPIMEEINPAARTHILDAARRLDEVSTLYKKSIEEARSRVQEGNIICIDALLREEAPRTLLFELLSPLGFHAARVDDVFASLQGNSSGKLFLSDTHRVLKDRNRLLVESLDVNPVRPVLTMKEQPYTPDFVIPREKHIACFDADKLLQPLTLRLAQTGDMFVPFGMRGCKLVSDYLTDRKFSLLQKQRQWVLCSGDDICWLVGERSDNRFRVDEKTKRVLLVSMDRS